MADEAIVMQAVIASVLDKKGAKHLKDLITRLRPDD
jgi:hypothetical protein